MSSGILSERPDCFVFFVVGLFVFSFCFPLPRARCYLIEAMHNSNRQIHQVTLSGEVLLEYRFYVIGFVPADVVRLKKDVWFSKLDSNQIDSVERFLAGSTGAAASR